MSRKRALSRDAFGVTVPDPRPNDDIERAVQHAVLFLDDRWSPADVKRIIERIREEKRVIHREEPKGNMQRSNRYKFHFNWCSRLNAFICILRKVLKEFSHRVNLTEIDSFIRAQLHAWITAIFSVPTTFCAAEKNIKDKYEAIEDILLFMLETVLSQVADCAFNQSYTSHKNDDVAIFRAKVVVRALHARYMTSFQSTKNQYSGLFPSEAKIKKKSGGEKTFAKTIELVRQVFRDMPDRQELLKIRHEPLNPLQEEPYGCCDKASDPTYHSSFCNRSPLLDFFLGRSPALNKRMSTPVLSPCDTSSSPSRTSSARTSPSLPMKLSPPQSPVKIQLPMPNLPPLAATFDENLRREVELLRREVHIKDMLNKYTMECFDYLLGIATNAAVFPTTPPAVQYNDNLPVAEQQKIFLGVWDIIARVRENRKQQYLAQKEQARLEQARFAAIQRAAQSHYDPFYHTNVPSMRYDTSSLSGFTSAPNLNSLSGMNDSYAPHMYESSGGPSLDFIGSSQQGVGSLMDGGSVHSSIVPQPIVSAESVSRQQAARASCVSTPSMLQPMGANTNCPPSNSFVPSRPSMYPDVSLFTMTSISQSGATDRMNPYFSDNGRGNTFASASQPAIFQPEMQGSCTFGCNGNAVSQEVMQSSFGNFSMDVDNVNE